MKDMINHIIEMDKKARAVTEQAEKDKLNIDQEIASLKGKMRESYLEKAHEKIEKIKISEQKKAEKLTERILRKQEQVAIKLDETYKEREKEWVQEIFDRCLIF